MDTILDTLPNNGNSNTNNSNRYDDLTNPQNQNITCKLNGQISGETITTSTANATTSNSLLNAAYTSN